MTTAESDSSTALSRRNVTFAGNPNSSQTVVFSHGFGTDQAIWGKLLPHFADDYRIVLFDHAGAGKSRQDTFSASKYMKLDGYVRDLLELCAALHLQDALYVGHSMGGMVGLLAGLAQPGYLRAQAIINTSPCFHNERSYAGGFSNEEIDGIYHDIHANYEAWADRMAPIIVGVEQPESVGRKFATALKTIPGPQALTVLASIFQSDYRERLPQITLPTLIVQCQRDALVPVEVARYMNQHIAGSELALIDASGHLPHLTAPEAVAGAILPFFARIGGALPAQPG